MKIGVCSNAIRGGHKNALLTGADYFECNFTVLTNATEEEFLLAKENISADGLAVYSANCMLPGEISLIGENATSDEVLNEYLNRGFFRAASLGIKRVVLGSGKARSFPEGYSKDRAYEELASRCEQIGDMAKKGGCIVTLEPLRRAETNMINTLSEGGDFVRKLNHPNFKLLADSYHMRAENEGVDVISENIVVISHVHIAEAEMGSEKIRVMPNFEDKYNIKEFIIALKTAGYKGSVTVEADSRSGNWTEDAKIAVAAIKSWL